MKRTSPDSLDAAWAEAVAALPQGCFIESLSYSRTYDNWSVRVGRSPKLMVHGGGTPASALRALTAELGRRPA